MFSLFGKTLEMPITENWQEDLYGVRPRPRWLESTTSETEDILLPAGEFGDDSITSIPFQVRSFVLQAFSIIN